MSDRPREGRRVLYLVGGAGNAERVDVSDLFARRLAAMGLRVDYVIFDREAGAAWRKDNWHGATAYIVGRSRYRGLAGAVHNKLYELGADLRTFWLTFNRPYDLIQIRDKFVVAFLCLMAAKLRKRPFVYWMSYPYVESRLLDAAEGRALVPWITRLGGKVSGWLLYRVILPRSDHVFVQSEQMKKDVAEEGIGHGKMSPVPMGVSEDLLEKQYAEVVPQTILYLGTLIRVRHLEVLIEALGIVRRRHERATLVFVGDGESPGDREFLEEYARSVQLEDAVVFTGMLPMDLAHEKAGRSEVCVSPFFPTPVLQSTSPTKLCEYMALGRPVVANSHPEQDLVLRESGAGITVEWSAAGFAEAIVRLFDDPAEANEMGRRGKEYIRRHRTYPIIAAQVAAKYRELLAARGRPEYL